VRGDIYKEKLLPGTHSLSSREEGEWEERLGELDLSIGSNHLPFWVNALLTGQQGTKPFPTIFIVYNTIYLLL